MAITARLTYVLAPDSLQGALAAGLLVDGPRFLEVAEDCGRFLARVLASQEGVLALNGAGCVARRWPAWDCRSTCSADSPC